MSAVEPGPMPEALLDVGQRRVAVAQLGLVVAGPAGQLDRRRAAASCRPASSRAPGRASRSWVDGHGRARRRRAGCSGPASRSGCPGSARRRSRAASPTPCRPAPTRPSHGASSTLVEVAEAGAAEAGPALALLLGVDLLGVLDLSGRHPEEDHVVHDRRGCPAARACRSGRCPSSGGGRAGSSGSRRCRRRSAPRACTASAWSAASGSRRGAGASASPRPRPRGRRCGRSGPRAGRPSTSCRWPAPRRRATRPRRVRRR